MSLSMAQEEFGREISDHGYLHMNYTDSIQWLNQILRVDLYNFDSIVIDSLANYLEIQDEQLITVLVMNMSDVTLHSIMINYKVKIVTNRAETIVNEITNDKFSSEVGGLISDGILNKELQVAVSNATLVPSSDGKIKFSYLKLVRKFAQ